MTEEYSSKDFDHLGIVSAMCDEINLVNSIAHIPQVTKPFCNFSLNS